MPRLEHASPALHEHREAACYFERLGFSSPCTIFLKAPSLELPLAEMLFEERPSLNAKIYIVFAGKSDFFFSKRRSVNCVIFSKASMIHKR